MIRFDDQVAVVTGSGRGLGEAYAGYGKDSFPGQPYEPLKLQKPLLHPISTITYEKSFI